MSSQDQVNIRKSLFSRDEQFIRKLNDIIESNIGDERFGVSEMDNALSMSRVQLYRKIMKINGKSANKYISGETTLIRPRPHIE